MTGSFTPRLLHDVATRPTEPQAVVEAFLGAMAAADIAGAGEFMAEDILYVNVGLPPVRGRRRAVAVLRPLARPGAFEVYLHAVAAHGSTVLTDRTDALVIGRLRLQFWVTGRFEVNDGLITLWRDSFDYVDMFRGFWRGLAGVVVPALRPGAPAAAETQPGRH